MGLVRRDRRRPLHRQPAPPAPGRGNGGRQDSGEVGTPARLERQARLDQRGQAGGQAGQVEPSALDMSQQHHRGLHLPVRRAPHGEVEEGGPQGEDVRRLGRRLAARLLRRGEGDGAQGERRTRAFDGVRNAEVDQERAGQRQQGVLRFDVPVDDPAAVQGHQCLHHSRGDGRHGPGGQRPLLAYEIGKGRGGYVLDGHPGPRGSGVGVEYAGGVRGVDAPGQVHLPCEPLPVEALHGAVGEQSLDRDERAPAAGRAR